MLRLFTPGAVGDYDIVMFDTADLPETAPPAAKRRRQETVRLIVKAGEMEEHIQARRRLGSVDMGVSYDAAVLFHRTILDRFVNDHHTPTIALLVHLPLRAVGGGDEHIYAHFPLYNVEWQDFLPMCSDDPTVWSCLVAFFFHAK